MIMSGSRPGGVSLIRNDLPGGLAESHKMAQCVSQSALRENAAPSPYPQHRSEGRIRTGSVDVGFIPQARRPDSLFRNISISSSFGVGASLETGRYLAR